PKKTSSVRQSHAVRFSPMAGSNESGGSAQATLTVPPRRPPETGCGPGTCSDIRMPVFPLGALPAGPDEQAAIRGPAAPTAPAAPVRRRNPRRSIVTLRGVMRYSPPRRFLSDAQALGHVPAHIRAWLLHWGQVSGSEPARGHAVLHSLADQP